MTSKENVVAQKILDSIKNCAEDQPEKAERLAATYSRLMAAGEIRARIERDEDRWRLEKAGKLPT